MNRKTIKTRTGAYHVTLPIRLVEEFDELLDYKQSRSRLIAHLMQGYVDGDNNPLATCHESQLLAILLSRFDQSSFEWKTLKTMFDSLP